MLKLFQKGLLLIVVLGLAAVAVSPGRASAPPPAQAAESLRSALFSAQRELQAGADGSAWLQDAQVSYDTALHAQLTAADPGAAQRAAAGFAAMQQALQAGNIPAFAAARSQTWTAVLAGSLVIVERSLEAGDLDAAQDWLAVREFRTATRFARPNADATRALVGLSSGEMDLETALQFLHADLYDSYQARLAEALRELETVHDLGFDVRRAELAGLARGYFALLAPAYGEQRSAAGLRAAEAAFDGLLAAALNATDLAQPLADVAAALDGFRAAPLSPTEQARRAGQLLRYVNLVAVEYGRGVSNGRVTLQFEIQEAVSFQEAAQAAFDDLQPLLMEFDDAATREAAALLRSTQAHLQAANTGGAVAEADTLRAEADQLLSLLDGLMPEEWKQGSAAGDFDVIASMLDQMENAVRAGDYPAAESARIEAYAIMESGPEARLMSMAPDLKVLVEELFWNGNAETSGLSRLLARQAPLQELRTVRVALDEQLKHVEELLSERSSPATTLTNATIIVFREGLEAVIILASLMGSLKVGANRKYRLPLWVGSGLALLATVLTWMLAREVLQSLARYGEMLEAVVSLIAIVVLLLVTNWFFHKSYWDDWLARFHAQKRTLLTGQAGLFAGLVALGFASVYREGLETVLFLQALVLDGGAALVMGGIAIGLALTLLVGVLTFRFQNRLPHKQMLVATGVLIGAVLLVMVGKTVHVFQLVGWLPATLIPGVSLPYWLGLWFGVFPSWEGLALQLLAAGFVIGSYFLAEGLRKRQRTSGGMRRPDAQLT